MEHRDSLFSRKNEYGNRHYHFFRGHRIGEAREVNFEGGTHLHIRVVGSRVPNQLHFIRTFPPDATS